MTDTDYPEYEYFEPPDIEPPEETVSEVQPDFTETVTDTDYPEYEYFEPPSKEPDLYPQIDEDKGVVQYLDVETGEIIEESPLGVKVEDDKITYYDVLTGEIISEVENYGMPEYDASAFAVDYLRGLFDNYGPVSSGIFNDMLDRLIEKCGVNAVSDAFMTKNPETGRTLVEDIEDADSYQAIIVNIGNAIDYLPLTNEEKDELRNQIFTMEEFFEE